jgi:hypothetical protein
MSAAEKVAVNHFVIKVEFADSAFEMFRDIDGPAVDGGA